ncbi:aspartyl protease [Lentilactobacillus fungorum]|uniref:Aspartyl protease n=2 Tax=Lentilactobacillus fungorum TaxID=2201250 RepID=A0ABQ3W1M1_9LACO|nr:aspartyl protease [Lentilactobacillus fungorum]
MTALGGLLAFGVGTAISTHPANAAKTTIVNVALKPTNEADLTNYVYDTVDPTSAQFHQYLTPEEFADKFGQSDSAVQLFKDYLKRYHVQTQAYPGNLSLKLTATTTNMQKAFKAKAVKKDGKTTTAYQLPGQLSTKVVAVIGLYPKQSAANNKTKKTTKKATTHKHSATLSADLSTTDKPDTRLVGNAFSKKYGAAKFANAYHLNTLYNQRLQGQGQRIGIINTSDVRDSDLVTYWHQAGVNDDLNRVQHIYPVDSKAQAQKAMNVAIQASQMEATLDAQSASSVAPQAGIDLYSGDVSGTRTSLPSSHYATFMTAISGNRDQQLTSSMAPGFEVAAAWDDPSATVRQYSHAFNLILEQAAAQGITVFQASGDRGPYAQSSAKENHLMSTSPYQVLVGGTTLPYQKIIANKVVTVTKERAWGDTYSSPAADTKYSSFSGGGGGFSALNPTPRYQQGISGVNTFRAINYLTFKNGKYQLTKHPRVIFGTGHSRNLPDVAGNADRQTGYASYVSGQRYSINAKTHKAVKVTAKLWGVDGGTSFTTPQMAAANAVINSGRRTSVGFWNPQIYRFAQESDSPFNVLDDADNNDNLYYTGQPGKLYNQATGLGTINFEKLNSKFSDEG